MAALSLRQRWHIQGEQGVRRLSERWKMKGVSLLGNVRMRRCDLAEVVTQSSAHTPLVTTGGRIEIWTGIAVGGVTPKF
jgi:hypothetical protein